MKTSTLNQLIENKTSMNTLYSDIQSELKIMENMLFSICDAKNTMLTDLFRIISAGGKRLRPILALICYRMGSGQDYEIVPLMYMLELMHTASLVHDDVVDNAKLRRNCATINTKRGVCAAVQSGDFLLAKAMDVLNKYRGSGINEELAGVSAQMCIGELTQLRARYNTYEQNRDSYYLQIYRKTASLIAASCYTGALAGGMEKSPALMLKTYGEKLGVAFQFRDDLMDYRMNKEEGKAPGQDIKNGIFTLPVLCLLEKGVPDKVRHLLEKRNKTWRQTNRLMDYIETNCVLNDIDKLVRTNSNEAIDALRDFPESAEKTALVELAKSLIKRHI